MSDLKEKLRHWSYHRQRLGRTGARMEEVLRDVIGVYSAHPTAPLSLAARLNRFHEDDFHALDERKRAFRVPAMRLTIYMLPAESAPMAFAATVPPASDPVWKKRYSQKGRFLSDYDYVTWRKKIVRLCEKPKAAAEIKEEVAIPDPMVKSQLNRMAYEGVLLRIGADSLRSNRIRYVSTRTWADDRFDGVDAERSLEWLAGAYLQAFGPARVKDFRWWAGIPAARAKRAIDAVETVRIDGDHLLPAGDMRDFDSFEPPGGDTLAVLPQWDCYVMGYAPDGRARFVDPEVRDKVYGSIGATGGNAMGTVLVNGSVRGSWSSRFAGNRMGIRLEMFEKTTGRLDRDIRGRFEDIATVLGAKEVVIEKG